MQGIKLVSFDFDQTLINSQKGFNAAFTEVMVEFKRFLENHGYNLELENYYSQLKKKMDDLDAEKIYNRDEWWNPLLNELEITEIQFNKNECQSLTKLYWDVTTEKSEFYPDTLEILKYLKEKQYKIGLITDTDGTPGRKQTRLQKSGLKKYFDGIVIAGEDTPKIKPDPAPFLKLTSMLDVTPKESIMVGDKPFTDIKGAKEAGFYTVLILRVRWKVDPTPDYEIKELIEIKSIL